MAHPKPEVGLVIGYSYLWHNEAKQKQYEGLKNRPYTIIVSVLNKDQDQIVMVLPITHTKPDASNEGIKIPQRIKELLGLDGERSC